MHMQVAVDFLEYIEKRLAIKVRMIRLHGFLLQQKVEYPQQTFSEALKLKSFSV